MKFREYLRKFMILLSVALGTLPAAPMLFSQLDPQSLPWTPVFSLVFLVLSVLGLLTPGKWRLAWAVPVALGLGVLCVVMAPEGKWIPWVLCWVLYAFVLLWSLQLGSWDRTGEMPPLGSLSILGLQLLGQLVLFGDSLKPEPVLGSCEFLFKGSFLAFLLLTVLGLNRGSMNEASGDKRSVTHVMRRKNIWMTLGLFGLAVGASFIPYIYEWIRKAVLWVVMAVLWLISRLLPGEDSGEVSGEAGGMDGLPVAEETEPSLFMEILEIVLMVVAFLVLLVLLCWMCVKVFRLIRMLLRKLRAKLEKYAAAVSEDYIDEITDTRETGEGSRSRIRIGKARPKAPKNPTPEEKVRYRYKLLLWKHPEWTKGTTARETLPETASEIYERARYSDHPVSEAEAEEFQNYKLQVTNYK
jgi:hypothetical protein